MALLLRQDLAAFTLAMRFVLLSPSGSDQCQIILCQPLFLHLRPHGHDVICPLSPPFSNALHHVVTRVKVWIFRLTFLSFSPPPTQDISSPLPGLPWRTLRTHPWCFPGENRLFCKPNSVYLDSNHLNMHELIDDPLNLMAADQALNVTLVY